MSKICEHKYCNNEFKPRGIKKYCSRKCKQNSHNIRLKKNNKRAKYYVFYKKSNCEECGFIPIHSCQLDVDHIDGNKLNNNPSNLRTLCANCHRLKTYNNRDWESKGVI